MSNKKKYMILGDVHGQHEKLRNCYHQFLKSNFDKLILIGDYADSFTRSNEDILRCFSLLIEMKQQLKENLIILKGNHELHYELSDNSNVRCAGYRPEMYASLHYYLTEYKDYFQYAYSVGNHLFTHAGVSAKWYTRNYFIINKWIEFCGIDVDNPTYISHVINSISKTSDAPILYSAGHTRGGHFNSCGGPLWCDRSEIMDAPMPGLHQIIGHTPQKFINKQTIFNSGKSINNTSITFIDVLNTTDKCLKLEINE